MSVKYAGALLRGLLRGTARDRWGCFENLTLTLYGYGSCALTGVLAAATALLTAGPGGAVRCLAASLAGMYLGLLAVGVLTMARERRRIPGAARQKALCCLTFPLFMLTYIPVSVCALFSKFQWTPVRHTVAVGLDAVSHNLTKL